MTEGEVIEQLEIFPEWNREDRWLDVGDMEELVNTCIKALEEIRQYRAIGTVEECREARKRQNGKKVTLSHNGCVKDKRKAFCPNCGLVIHGKGMIGYCSCCGQKLDWSE